MGLCLFCNVLFIVACDFRLPFLPFVWHSFFHFDTHTLTPAHDITCLYSHLQCRQTKKQSYLLQQKKKEVSNPITRSASQPVLKKIEKKWKCRNAKKAAVYRSIVWVRRHFVNWDNLRFYALLTKLHGFIEVERLPLNTQCGQKPKRCEQTQKSSTSNANTPPQEMNRQNHCTERWGGQTTHQKKKKKKKKKDAWVWRKK